MPSRKRLLELGGIVTDDRDAGRLKTETQCLPHVERAVEVSPLAANELAARDDDGDAGTAQRGAPRERELTALRHLTRTPATDTITLSGRRER